MTRAYLAIRVGKNANGFCSSGKIGGAAVAGGVFLPKAFLDPDLRPRSIVSAVVLLVLEALLGLGAAVIPFVYEQHRTIFEPMDSTVTAYQQTLQTIGLAVPATVLGVLGTTMWLIAAWKTHQGRRWARTLAAVSFIFVSFLVISMAAASGLALQTALHLTIWCVGLIVILLLWSQDATRYFEQREWMRRTR